MQERHIAFDTETTGLDPAAGHRIVEIGCVEMVGYVRTGKHFHVYLNPERDIPPEAQKVHGLSREFLADKPRFADIAEEFVRFVGDSVLVAHNASFDMKFINHELKTLGHSPFPTTQSIDTLLMARKKYPGQPASLDALCRRFQIDLSARTLHGALLDAELLCDVYLELMGGRQSSFGLAVQETQQEGQNASSLHHMPFPRRYFPASAEEKESHAAFIASVIKK
jgi:DNA polymerase III subunit epsilon